MGNGSGQLHRLLNKLHTASAPAMQGEMLLPGRGLPCTAVSAGATQPACSIGDHSRCWQPLCLTHLRYEIASISCSSPAAPVAAPA